MSNSILGASKVCTWGTYCKNSERQGYEMRVQSRSAKKVIVVFGFIHVKMA